MDFLLGHHLPAAARNGFHRAGLIGDAPTDVELVLALAAHALGLPVDEEFHLVGVVIVGPEVYLLAFLPVPVGEEVQDGLVRPPLALIQVINVFGESGQVDDAEVGAARGPAVGRGLADVVEAGPDVLAGDEVVVLHVAQGAFVGIAPRHVAVVVGRAREGFVIEGYVPTGRPDVHRVAGHPVVAAGHQGGNALRDDEGLAGEILRHAGKPVVVVVEADDVQRTRAEQVVAGIRLVATGGDGARGVEGTGHVGQFLGQQGVDGQFAAFLGQHVGAMAEVQDEVGLGQAEGVGLGVAPLLQHLVADAPHEDGGMVAVAADEVGQVALVPFIEVAGIVVRRLLLAPHVEGLIHHDEAHAVAEVQQLRCGRVVRTADAVAAHLLQNFQLTLQGTDIDGRTQATQVVVHADAVNLHRFPVERETFLRIKAEVAEAERGDIRVHHLTVGQQGGLHIIEVGTLHAPQFGRGDIRLLQGLGQRVGLGGHGCGVKGDHGLALGIHQLGAEFQRGVGLLRVLHRGADGQAGTFLGDVLGRDIRAPLGHMHGIEFGEPYVTVDAAAGIPARIGLLGIVHADSHHVLTAPVEVGRQVVAEGNVAVGTRAQFMAVDVDGGVHIHAVKVDVEAFALVGLVHGEGLAVPADAAGEGTTARA